MAAHRCSASSRKIAHGPAPIALVIVPTRELAAQVREELRWLLARHRHPRSHPFTGGTPIVRRPQGPPARRRAGDRHARAPRRSAAPRAPAAGRAAGRSCSTRRTRCSTSASARIWRRILQAAPATRRTLLLSATLPPEIRALARSAISATRCRSIAQAPREGGAAHGAGAHDDIAYRAHLSPATIGWPRVVNVLRADDSARAIVFCTTREGVAEMHAALTARGFAATAISGDRAQAERDRALEQLRRGDARVLVATNVAARGLHLPDVDLIVHADLPLNADSLIHRSGRTGRAGRKGTAVADRHGRRAPQGRAAARTPRTSRRPGRRRPTRGRSPPPPRRAASTRCVGRAAARGGRRGRRAAGDDRGQASGARARRAACSRASSAACPSASAFTPSRSPAATPDRHPAIRAASQPRRLSPARASRFRINIGAKDKRRSRAGSCPSSAAAAASPAARSARSASARTRPRSRSRATRRPTSRWRRPRRIRAPCTFASPEGTGRRRRTGGARLTHPTRRAHRTPRVRSTRPTRRAARAPRAPRTPRAPRATARPRPRAARAPRATDGRGPPRRRS